MAFGLPIDNQNKGYYKEGYIDEEHNGNEIGGNPLNAQAVIDRWTQIAQEENANGRDGDMATVNLWDEYFGKLDLTNQLIARYQKKFTDTGCPFIRSVLKSPQGKPPPKPCHDQFNATYQLYDSVNLSYFHIPGHRAFVEFEASDAKIGLASNVICAFTKTVSNVPPAEVGVTWEWAAITVQMNCASEAIKGLICRKVGNDLVSMLRSVQKQVYEGNVAFGDLEKRSDYGDNSKDGTDVEHRDGNEGITVKGDPTGYAVTNFIANTRSQMKRDPINSIYQLNMPRYKDIRITAQRIFCKYYSVAILADLNELFQNEPKKMAQLSNFQPTCEAMCIYNDHPNTTFEMTKADIPDYESVNNVFPILKLNPQLSSDIGCKQDAEYRSSYCLIDVGNSTDLNTSKYNAQNIGVAIGQSVLDYLEMLHKNVKGFDVLLLEEEKIPDHEALKKESIEKVRTQFKFKYEENFCCDASDSPYWMLLAQCGTVKARQERLQNSSSCTKNEKIVSKIAEKQTLFLYMSWKSVLKYPYIESEGRIMNNLRREMAEVYCNGFCDMVVWNKVSYKDNVNTDTIERSPVNERTKACKCKCKNRKETFTVSYGLNHKNNIPIHFYNGKVESYLDDLENDEYYATTCGQFCFSDETEDRVESHSNIANVFYPSIFLCECPHRKYYVGCHMNNIEKCDEDKKGEICINGTIKTHTAKGDFRQYPNLK